MLVSAILSVNLTTVNDGMKSDDRNDDMMKWS